MTTFFVVQGRRHFPTDMLRHDVAKPVSEADTAKTVLPDDAPDYQANRRVTLVTNSRKQITHARWSSFGWVVVAEAASAEAAEGEADERMGPMSNWC